MNPTPSVWKEKVVSTWNKCTSSPFLTTWMATTAAVLLLPLLSFTISRNSVYNYDENNNNNNNNNNDQQQQYDEYGNYIGNRQWWQFWKSNNDYEENNDQQQSQDEFGAPWWWMWNNRDRGEPENEGNGVLIFVYLWTVVSWLVVSKLIYQAALARDYFGVRNSLMGFANVSFLVCVLLAGTKETIQMEGREIEETGWYGQTSVLVFLTNVLALLGCLACAVWAHNLAKRSIQNHKDTDAILNGGFVEMGGGDDVVEGGMNQETLTVAAVSPSQSA